MKTKIESIRETDERRAPKIADDAKMLFDEPGRVFPKGMMAENYGLDCRSHWFRVTQSPDVSTILTLYVSHGGGEESFQWHSHKPVIEAMKAMDSDSRYLLLHEIHNIRGEGERKAAQDTAAFWRKAAAQKRIKTRKMPGRDAVKVTIEPEQVNHG